MSVLLFFDFGVSTNALNKMARSYVQENMQECYDYYLSAFWLTFFITPLFILISYLIIKFIFFSFMLPPQDKDAFIFSYFLLSSSIFFVILAQPIYALARAVQEVKIPMFSLVFSTLIGFIVCVILSLKQYGIYSIAVSYALRSFLCLIGCYYYAYIFFNKNKNNISYSHFLSFPKGLIFVKELLKGSPPAFIISISTSLSLQSENLMIAYFIRPELVVCYSITKRFLDFTRIISDSFINSIIGPYKNLYHSENKERINQIIIELIFTFCFLIFIGISLYILFNCSFVLFWVKNEKYLLNNITMLFMSVSLFFGLLSLLLSRLIFTSDYPSQGAKSILVEFLLKVILGSICLFTWNIVAMLTVFTLISIIICIYNTIFIYKIFSFDKCKKNYITLFLNIILLVFLIYFNFISFSVYCINENRLLHSFFLLSEIGLISWYHPFLRIRKMIINKLKVD